MKNPQKRRKKWCVGPEKVVRKPWGLALGAILPRDTHFYVEGSAKVRHSVRVSRDAMNKLIYVDDSQITFSETIHINIDSPIKIRRASAALLAAYSKGDEFLYVRIDDAPDFIQLPQ